MKKYPEWTVKASMGLNRITGGPKGWTMCARLWSWRLAGRTGAKVMVDTVDGFFWHVCGDQYHCWNAYKRRNRITVPS